MDLSLRGMIYLAILVAVLALFQRLKRVFWIFSLAILPGTFCHELCHLCAGALLNGRPTRFSVVPRREGRSWVMGSVAFAHIRWYNAFFLGAAPLLLLPAAWALLAWRLGGQPAVDWGEALWLYLAANLVQASLPSRQDLRVAARSPIGWLLLGAAAAWGWVHFRQGRPVVLQQVQETGLALAQSPFRDPGAGVRLGQPHQVR